MLVCLHDDEIDAVITTLILKTVGGESLIIELRWWRISVSYQKWNTNNKKPNQYVLYITDLVEERVIVNYDMVIASIIGAYK